MPDNGPTIRPVDFHGWLIWREQHPGGPFAVIEAACDELYGLALEDIVEITGSAEPAGLLGAQPAIIPPEEIERRHLTAPLADDRHGAFVLHKHVPILNPRGPGVWPPYAGLTFRLAKPQAFSEYLSDPRSLPRWVISLAALRDILLNDENFRRHRDEKLQPATNLLRAVVALRRPDLVVPRDSRLRKALADPSVVEMYGEPRRGQPPAWARALFAENRAAAPPRKFPAK